MNTDSNPPASPAGRQMLCSLPGGREAANAAVKAKPSPRRASGPYRKKFREGLEESVILPVQGFLWGVPELQGS